MMVTNFVINNKEFLGGRKMATWTITLIDKQTKKRTTVKIEAKNNGEAKAIAMRDYGVAYEVK